MLLIKFKFVIPIHLQIYFNSFLWSIYKLINKIIIEIVINTALTTI